MGPALERGRHAQTALFCATANYWLSANNSTRPDHPQHILLFLQTIRVGNRCFCQGACGQLEVGAQRVPSLLVKIWNNWKKIQGFSSFINLIFPPFDLPLFLLVESIMWESCHIWSRSGQTPPLVGSSLNLLWELRSVILSSVFLLTLQLGPEIHAWPAPRLDRDQYFMRGGNHTRRPNHQELRFDFFKTTSNQNVKYS